MYIVKSRPVLDTTLLQNQALSRKAMLHMGGNQKLKLGCKVNVDTD